MSVTSSSPGATVAFTLDGESVAVPDDGASLLEALRDRLGRRDAKDGCSPQGQCGCCTVLVDGAARVSCVTPVRRVAGRSVTTLDGLDAGVRSRWADALCAKLQRNMSHDEWRARVSPDIPYITQCDGLPVPAEPADPGKETR